ncbi:hypothetical protein SteCoe_20451 [Stentor coeruleus]|uniref:Uncharacterized protein n=1 Tax=Stentor coeruleus TaxID=5963 RepID=A0A1R2BRT7_9CILI|nr:hypothetical protein SteCoe_20451 [Stentor coeruleus]
MNAVFLIIGSLFLGDAITSLDLNQQIIGSSCMASPTFAVSSFNVSPWPPILGSNLALNMTGVFSLNEYISEIVVSTYFNHNWKSHSLYIDQEYLKDTLTTFFINSSSGSQSGNYAQQMVIIGGETTLTYLACWQFAYYI